MSQVEGGREAHITSSVQRSAAPASAAPSLCEPDVIATVTLGTLATVERHSLAFKQLVERRLRDGRLVKEILHAIAGRYESEPFVTDEPLDRSVHRRHSLSLKLPAHTEPEPCRLARFSYSKAKNIFWLSLF